MYTLDVIISFDYGRSSTVELDSGNINFLGDYARFGPRAPLKISFIKARL